MGGKMNKENIRVLIIGSDSSVKGGITTVIDSFLKYKWPSNVDIDFLPTYIEEDILKKIVFFLKALIIYCYKLVTNSFDIAHIHMSYKGSFFRKLIIVKLGRLFKKKIIIHMHGSEFEIFYKNSNLKIKKMISDMFFGCDKIIVLGESWKEVVKKISENSEVSVLRNAVSLPKYIAKWSKNSINVLFLGVLIKRKGIDDLIESIKILSDRGVLDKLNYNFIIGGSGPEEKNIKHKISEYKIDKYVDMVGWVDGKFKEDLLRNSQIFILPSYNEGLPMGILEAMSFGIPVISTNVGSIGELVINDVNGYIVDTNSPQEIADVLEKMTSSKWEKLSSNSRICIKQEFNSSKYFEDIIDIYKETSKGIRSRIK